MKLYDILWNYEAVRLGQQARRLLQDGVGLVTVWAGPPDGPYREFRGKWRLWRLLWRRNPPSHGSRKQEEVRE